MKNKVLVNLLLILLLFTFFETISFFQIKNQIDSFKINADKLPSNNTKVFKTKYKILEKFNPTIFRKSFYIENSTEKPVLWFGCSFAEGAGLEDFHTPCYKLSQLTNSSCINRSKGATGTQFIYYQLKHNNFKEIAPDVDFIIYTFIWNHIHRLYNYQINPTIYMLNCRYKLKNGELQEYTPFYYPIYSSFLVKKCMNKIVQKQIDNEVLDFSLFNTVMFEINKELKKLYPNAKFIMIEFPEYSKKELPEFEIKNLENSGITVVRAKDFFNDIDCYDDKYWLPDKIHPREELWDMFLPKFTEKYLK